VLLSYLSLPAIIAVTALVHALGREPLGIGVLLGPLVGGFFFYAAPHLLWAAIARGYKPSGFVLHSGFIAASLALVTVVALSFTLHDPSGLPYQWLLYWPLALVLQVVLVGASIFHSRRQRHVGV